MLPLFGSDPIRVTHGPTEAERVGRRTVEPVHAASPTEKIRARRRRQQPGRPSGWEGRTVEEHLGRAALAAAGETHPEKREEEIPGDPFLGRHLDVDG